METKTAPREGFTNLSSWTVKFTRSLMGTWNWEAEHASNGAELSSHDLGAFGSKENAEADAVARLEAFERSDSHEKINGFELSERVRQRET